MGYPITSATSGNIPSAIANALLRGETPISLLDIQLPSGTQLFLSDTLMAAPSVFPGAGIATYKPWITEDGAPSFSVTDTLVQQTSTARIQNLTGNSIQRDNSLLFSEQDLWGALFVYRLWLSTCEYALFTSLGQVADTEVDETEMELTLESWLNFSKIAAPDCEIGNNCQNVFGSQQCGSTAAVSCRNSYGNCSQINRFKGLITQWNSGVYSIAKNSGFAQPIPPLNFNPRRAS